VPEPADALEADPDPAGVGLFFMAPAARITAVVRRGGEAAFSDAVSASDPPFRGIRAAAVVSMDPSF